MLGVFENEKLIAAYPVTIGSANTASPVGEWKVRGIAKMPRFRYDKEMLEHGERSGNFYMFCWPVVLLLSAKPPIATLYPPLVSAVSAEVPTAVLLIPVVTESSALSPTAVFPPRPHAVGQSCALRGGESANQQSAIASVKKPQRNGERLLDLISVFIFWFISLEVALLNA